MIDTYPRAHVFLGGIASRLDDVRTHTTVFGEVDTHVIFFCNGPHSGPEMPDRFPSVFPTHTAMRDSTAALAEYGFTPMSPISERTRHPVPRLIR